MVMKQECISSTHTIQHIMSLDFAVFSNSDGDDATLLVGGWVGAGRRMICNCKCLGIHLVTRTLMIIVMMLKNMTMATMMMMLSGCRKDGDICNCKCVKIPAWHCRGIYVCLCANSCYLCRWRFSRFLTPPL